MIRIIAGQWRGRKLQAPKGHGTRPSSDRVRETLFSMLVSRLGSFEGLRVADLFAGSGILGLEALSRGAADCTFVEHDAEAIRALNANITTLQAGDRCHVQAASVFAARPVPAPFDLILCDPPYDTGAGVVALDKLVRLGWIGPASWVSLETAASDTPQFKGFDVVAERRVGKSCIRLCRLQPADASDAPE